MSDLTATNCGCGCENGNGMSSCLWIILLLCCCGGCGNGFSGNGFGNDSCLWIIGHLCGGGGGGNTGAGGFPFGQTAADNHRRAGPKRARLFFAIVTNQSPGSGLT